VDGLTTKQQIPPGGGKRADFRAPTRKIVFARPADAPQVAFSMSVSPSSASSAPYQSLCERAREIGLLESAAALLSWDQQTYMPPKALAHRAEQLGYFSGQAHRLFTAPQVGDWLRACEEEGFAEAAGGGDGQDETMAANVRQWRRKYDRDTRLPAELVEEFERARVIANEAWIEARRRSDFPHFAPHLERIFALSRERAERWGYEDTPYDALLEGYEPGARARDLSQLFADLRPQIVALLGPAAERSARIPADLLQGEYPIEAQQAFNREVATALGFDFAAGLISTTTHPFCSGLSPGDCRLTTRYDTANFLVSLYGVMHEAGHGMYEQGLDPAAFGTPAGASASLGIHESQSRLWENQVGRSRTFWEHWLPRAAHHFPHLAKRTPEEMFGAVNRVKPSFIRVEADQVTYDLHIILRFNLEKELLEGTLAVADLPGVWNEAFEESFGLRVPDDAHGCLQDVHWSEGLIGYFPTYTLGNLNAAQLFRRAQTELPALETELAAGQYGNLLGWLREKIHRKGQRLLPPELMQTATGEPTREKYHLEELRRKFVG
jgi:carboxypeptidase Taq